LRDEFSFVADRLHWGGCFRKSPFKLTRDDLLIAGAVEFERLSNN